MIELDFFLKRIRRDFFEDFKKAELYFAPGKDMESKKEIPLLDYIPMNENDEWGQNYTVGFFKVICQIPDKWAGKEIYAKLNFSGESLVFDQNLNELTMLTDASVFDSEFKKDLLCLTKSSKAGDSFTFYIESTANGAFGLNMDNDPDAKHISSNGDFTATVEFARFGVFNREVWQLANDLMIVGGFIEQQKAGGALAKKLEAAVRRSIAAYADDSRNAVRARKELLWVFELPARKSSAKVTAIGHAHIDTAWLWPLDQTIKKCGRTFACMVNLMDEYKDYVFGASAACHYEFVKRYYPDLYLKVKDKIASGRWEVQGGMFVEPDCNVTSGESQIRQFLYGKNFFKDEFGIEIKNLWVPDTFGYSANLPQIIRGCGCDYFVSQKISWNDTNKFPYHTFYWQGIDGSKVLCHFPPEDGYNSPMSVKSLCYGENNYNEITINNEFISLYGMGDGGGGPSAEYVERALRMHNFEGAPKVKFGRADEFFERASKYDNYPKWVGELYLELHRGTLTTQAKNKLFNRKFEQKLVELENLYSRLPLKDYPDNVLNELWKTLLINQFHDILPGSSIHEVYEDTKEDYQAMEEIRSRLLNKLENKLSDCSSEYISIINTLGYSDDVLIKLPENWSGAEDEYGNLFSAVDGKILTNIPAYGTKIMHRIDAAQKEEVQLKYGDLTLENDKIIYQFNNSGQLIKIFDKELKREFLDPGQRGNILSLYVDYPVRYEAWEIDNSFRDAKVCEAEPLKILKKSSSIFSALEIEYKIGSSKIRQNIVLLPESRELRFETIVDWNESRKMLRVGFENNIVCDEASYDLDYGVIKRSVYKNTSWDSAKFEVCCHKYFDVSERDIGLALLNDCKYGCYVEERFFDLNLLKSSKYPDFTADIGEHHIIYSLLPHDGDLADSDVISKAALLNRQPVLFNGRITNNLPFTVDFADSVTVEVVKKAHKEDSLIVRMVEQSGKSGSIKLKLNEEFHGLQKVNFIEWNEGEILETNGSGQIKLDFKPFEIRTFKLV